MRSIARGQLGRELAPLDPYRDLLGAGLGLAGPERSEVVRKLAAAEMHHATNCPVEPAYLTHWRSGGGRIRATSYSYFVEAIAWLGPSGTAIALVSSRRLRIP